VACANGARTALVAPGRRVSYADLNRETDLLSADLRQRGIADGRAVALLLPSGWQAIVWFFAVTGAGATAVPVNPRITASELRAILDDVEPDLLITVRRVPGRDIEAALGELRLTGYRLPPVAFVDNDAICRATGSGELMVDESSHPATGPDGPAPDTAAIFYTTGTTGTPKGVMHTHAGLLDSFDRMQELHAAFFSGSAMTRAARIIKLAWRYGIRLRHGIGHQIWMTPLPVYSIAGFRFVLHALLSGQRLVLMERFHPTEMLDRIQRERVNIVALAPSMLDVALDAASSGRYDLSSLLVVGVGAAPTSPALVRRARAQLGCAVVIGYGATETGGGVLVTRMDDGERQLAETAGRPFPGAEVKVVDDQRQEVPTGCVGELACRSAGLMAGYHGHRAATAEVIDQDGWYYTGDLATIDDQGYVRIVGRRRDLIIRGGANVVPAEVERVLLDHPAITEAAVVGVTDRAAGEAIWAFLVLAPAATPDLTEIRQHCIRRLDPGKVPDRLRILIKLPVNQTGEVHRVALRELAEQQILDRRARGGKNGADHD